MTVLYFFTCVCMCVRERHNQKLGSMFTFLMYYVSIIPPQNILLHFKHIYPLTSASSEAAPEVLSTTVSICTVVAASRSWIHSKRFRLQVIFTLGSARSCTMPEPMYEVDEDHNALQASLSTERYSAAAITMFLMTTCKDTHSTGLPK